MIVNLSGFVLDGNFAQINKSQLWFMVGWSVLACMVMNCALYTPRYPRNGSLACTFPIQLVFIKSEATSANPDFPTMKELPKISRGISIPGSVNNWIASRSKTKGYFGKEVQDCNWK